MSENDGANMARAWQAWLDSDEGKSCDNYSTLAVGGYLHNRLWRAFMAGVNAKLPEPPK